jgi:hypothetical protein
MNIYSKKNRFLLPNRRSKYPKFPYKSFLRYTISPFLIAASLVALLFAANAAMAVTVSAPGEVRVNDVTLYRVSFGLAELADNSWGVHAFVHYRPHWSRRWRMKSFRMPFSAESGQFAVQGDDLFLLADSVNIRIAEKRPGQPIRWHAVGRSSVSCRETKRGRNLILSNCKLEVN